MARKIERLSARFVESVKKPGLYNDGGGLYLQVKDGKSWVFRYGPQGRRYHGLGPLHAVTLSQARAKARECRQLLQEGTDPIAFARQAKAAARAKAAKIITFAAAAETFIDAHHAAWKNPRNRRQWLYSLQTHANPVLGKLPVAEIDTGLVMRVIEPLWRTKPETGKRVRMRIERVLDWATTHGYRTGENPARWQGHLDNLLPAPSKVRPVRHHRALPWRDVPAFVDMLRQSGEPAAPALEFLILCAARSGELIGATWDEFDLTQKLWTIPGARMKAGREHRVPLSDRAGEILEALPRRQGDRVFDITPMTFFRLLERMGRKDITPHGFRSTFRDWAAETTQHDNHVVEMALAHVVRNATEAAYRRGDLLDKRRRLMGDWSRFVGGANVVPIRFAHQA